MLAIKHTHHIDDFEKGPIRRSLFSNGAVSLFHKAENFSGAKVQLHFLAGSMFENEKQHGLSHLIEHMAFKDGETDIIRKLEMAGAGLNAYTYKENVCFEMSCLTKHLSQMFPLFLDNFLNIDFTDEQLQKEKKVILQELRDDLDDHETQAIEYVFKKNFSSNLGHSIGGSMTQVGKYSRKDVEDFYKKYYTPERMILVVVAGEDFLNLEQVFMDKMETFFKFKEKSPIRLNAKDRVKKLAHIKSTQKRKMENGLLVLSFDGPSLNSKRYYDYIVLDELLFEGMSSLFFKKLREEIPLVYGYGSSINCFSDCGNYLMIFNTSKKNLKPLKTAILDVFKVYSEKTFSPADIAQVKQRVVDSWELSFDDLEERVEFIAGTEIYQLNEFSTKVVTKKIEVTNEKTVQNLIKKISQQAFSELIYEPK